MAKTETVGSLQEMINANAAQKLKRDLHKFAETITSNPLVNMGWQSTIKLHVEGTELTKEEKPIYHKFSDLLNENWGTLYKAMYDGNIEYYIQSETEDLFAKIEQLRKDVDSLEYKSNNSDEY